MEGEQNIGSISKVYPTKFVVSSFCGGVAAMAGATVACPFDVIKTRLQSTHSYQAIPRFSIDGGITPVTVKNNKYYTNVIRKLSLQKNVINSTANVRNVLIATQLPVIWQHINYKQSKYWQPKFKFLHLLKSSVQNEGMSSLFKGLVPSFAAVVPSKAVYFGFYSVLKDFYAPVMSLDSHSNILCSSVTAGFIQASTISPLFMVRTRLQLSTSRMGIRDCVSEIYNLHGVKGFFRGLSATYLGLSETAIYFLLYENCKYYLRKHKYLSNDVVDAKNSAFYGVSAIISRIVATTCAYPHEVVRTRMRQKDANYRGLWHCFQSIYRGEGKRGFYLGLEVELLKKIPNVAVVFIVYETLMSYFASNLSIRN